jgi:ribosomal protein S18 acetylase RimI-like enzyme
MPDTARVCPTFRTASLDDLPAIIALLADDELGATRETPADPLSDAYVSAFEAISADANNELIVASIGGVVAGVLQLTFIPGLSRAGSWRAQIEGVRIHRDFRDRGLGRQLLEHALDRTRQRDCRLVQLTSDKRRSGALRFYRQLGFTASHEGFKLQL